MSRAAWQLLLDRQEGKKQQDDLSTRRARAILASMIPKARAISEDPSPFVSVLAPRRSSKSYSTTAEALRICEMTPNSRVLILGLTLKSAKENFWMSAPGGVQAFDQRFGLGLDFSYVDISWRHQNGSIGFLAGAETQGDIERLRGSKVEADLIIVDECKSFSPDRLRQLINDVLMPGLMTRNGRLILTGTPGSVCDGVFYEATSELSRLTDGTPSCIVYGKGTDPVYAGLDSTGTNGNVRWSAHSWTIQDNTSNPEQWKRALVNKGMQGWSDDHPTWRREYLGQWVEDDSELVYSYLKHHRTRNIHWEPTAGRQPGGDWHYLMGVDLGFEDDFAVNVAGFNEREDVLYHIESYRTNHLNVDEARAVLESLVAIYGEFDAIVVDAGNLGKMIMQTFADHGLNVVAADKVQKRDYIELLNADFASEKIRISRDSDLHHELCALTWDLSRGEKKYLARVGRLKENPNQPNHLCDAWLYLWRWASHREKAPDETPALSIDEAAKREMLEYLRTGPRHNTAADLASGHFVTDHLVRRTGFN
jgi:Terminase large subunit, T4likevirus-type, N-terminal